MSDLRISQLTSATTLTGTELVPAVQTGTTKKATAAQLKTYATSDLTTYGFGTSATATYGTDFTVDNWISRIYRILNSGPNAAVAGPGINGVVLQVPYDGTPNNVYMAMGGSTSNIRFFGGWKNGATALSSPTWREFAPLDIPAFTTRIGIGATSTQAAIVIPSSYTSTPPVSVTVMNGIQSALTVGTDVTGGFYNFRSGPNFAASGATHTLVTGFQAGMGTVGAGTAITNNYGYIADSSLGTSTQIINSYGLYSNLAAAPVSPPGLSRWNLYCIGAAPNYMAGALGIGSTSTTGFNLRVDRTLDVATSVGIRNATTFNSGVGTAGVMYDAVAFTQDTAFTLPSYIAYRAQPLTRGSASTVTNQYGFSYTGTTGAANNNFAFHSSMNVASGQWNIYMAGTADNYIAGNVGIGSNSFSGYTLRVNKALDNNSHKGIASEGQVTSGGSTVDYFYTNSSQATAVSTTLLSHYRATQGTYTSAPTSQAGFNADSTLTGAGTNNYGFRGQIASATGRWNLFMDGTAQNHLAGNLGIGTGKTIPTCALDVNGLVAQSTANTLAATGTTLATALALTAANNVVTSATAGTAFCVSLPNVVGARIWIFNNTAVALTVFPNSASGTINGGAAGAGVTLAASGKMQYVQIATNVWYTMS
jgi:hypothetical protein